MNFPVLNGALAQTTRQKSFHQRSKEEHQWVSLDFRLHPEIYSKGFKPFYDLGVMQSDVQRLWKLPKLLQMAFGSINNDVELEVHRLLNMYYDRKSNQVDYPIASIQKNEEMTNLFVDVTLIGVTIPSKAEFMAFLQNLEMESEWIQPWMHSDGKGERLNERTILLHETELGNSDSVSLVHEDSNEVYVEQSDCVRILRIPSEIIHDREVRNYKILIQNDCIKKLASLVVTITFHGTVHDSIYIPGKISASLYQLDYLTTEMVNIGIADYRLQCLNTVKSMGRLIIEYRPLRAIDNSTFLLNIIGCQTCNYSVDISGSIHYRLNEYSMSKTVKFFTLEKDIQGLRLQLDELKLDSRLHEILVSKLKCLVDDVDQEKIKVHNDILRCEYDLETEDSNDYFRIENRIKELEAQYSRLHRLRVVRLESIEKSIKDTESKNKTISALCAVIDTKSNDSDSIREWLIKLFQGNGKIQATIQQAFEKVFRMRDALILEKIKNVHFVTHDTTAHSSFPRGRSILSELDRVFAMQNVKHVISSSLHQTPQLYPREHLVTELQRMLNELVLNEVQRQEAIHPLLDSSLGEFSDDCTFIDTFDSEEDSIPRDHSSQSHDTRVSNDGNFCSACRSNPCSRVPLVDIQKEYNLRDSLTNSILALRRKRVSILKRNSLESSLTSINASILSQQRKADRLDMIIKLEKVDKELHDIFQSKKKGFVLIRSLHDYEFLMEVEAATSALTAEHDRLVAVSCASDFLNRLFNKMEEGWVFGVTDEDKKDIHILNMTGDIKSLQTSISQQEQINAIHIQSSVKLSRYQSKTHKQELSSFLDLTEKSIRIGLIYWLISYLRIMATLRSQKAMLLPEISNISRERNKMMQEHVMALERDARVKEFEEKAHRGALRIMKRREHSYEARLHKRHTKEAKDSLENSSALKIQKHYRAHLGKKVFHIWKNERESIYAWNALCHASSIAISRYWRGYMARTTANKLRAQIVEFVINIRRKEILMDEEDYWNTLNLGKHRRRFYNRRKKSL